MKHSIYLSGSIERSLDPYTWRDNFNIKLKGLYNVIIPREYTPPFEKDDEKYKKWVYETFIIPDIQDVLKSEYFFVKVDQAVLDGAGTISETCVASFYKKKIVYMVSDGLSPKDLPGWLLGCLWKAKQVKSIEEAIKYYKTLKGK